MEKLKAAIQDAQRRRDELAEEASAQQANPKQPILALEARIRRLIPINELPHQYQDAVIRQGEIIDFPRGSNIFREGSRDNFVHYLLEGSVALLIGAVTGRRLSANSEMSLFPLDEAGNERACSASVEQPAKVFKIESAALERQVDLARTAPPPPPDEVVDIAEADPSDWIVATLRDGLFAYLPIETIQHVLARVEEMEVPAGHVVVEQGRQGEYFYLLKEGTAEVSRRASGTGPAVHLATINPGGGFGEEALIANRTRNATVTMTSDGVLMKLTRDDFNSLIRDPLLSGVSHEQGDALVAEGAQWIDTRDAERFEISALPGAVNYPLPLVRLKWRDLDPAHNYVVYSEDPSASAVAAFLLSSRGLAACYVDDAVYPPLSEPADMTDERDPLPAEAATIRPVYGADTELPIPADPAPESPTPAPSLDPAAADSREIAPAEPAFYADTLSGQGLAQLVAEIRSDHQEIESQASADPTEATITGTAGISLEGNFFDFELDRLRDDESADPTHAPASDWAADAAPDPIGRAFRELEEAFRLRIEDARAQERDRVEQHVQTRITRVKKRAEQLIREKLLQARARDKARSKADEDRLRQRYEQLQRVVNKITHQKAEIQRSRRNLEQKLKAASELHRELSTLGQTMTDQIDNLEELMPDEASTSSG